MGGYTINVKADEQAILSREAARRGVTIRQLLKEALERKISEQRGGLVKRRR